MNYELRINLKKIKCWKFFVDAENGVKTIRTMIFSQVMVQNVTRPRFRVNMTCIHVIRSERVNDLWGNFSFVQILFLWVAFDSKLIFRITKILIPGRLTRSLRLGFWFSAKFSKFLTNFSNLKRKIFFHELRATN